MPDLLTDLQVVAGEAEVSGPSAFGVQDYPMGFAGDAGVARCVPGKKVPGIVAHRGLDTKIAEIRRQLDEAGVRLRAEAEALRDQYAAKIAGAEKDAETMMTGAREEADAILARAGNWTVRRWWPGVSAWLKTRSLLPSGLRSQRSRREP